MQIMYIIQKELQGRQQLVYKEASSRVRTGHTTIKKYSKKKSHNLTVMYFH